MSFPTDKNETHEDVLGVPVFSGSKTRLQKIIESWFFAEQSQLRVIVTPNPEQIMLAQKKPEFLQALQQADLALPDGIGVVWAGRFLSRAKGVGVFPDRIPGRLVFEDLVVFAARNKFRVLLIGGFGSVASVAAEKLQAHYPGLQIRSTSGPKDAVHPSRQEEQLVQTLIHEFQPHLIGVAFGAPKQEMWLQSHRSLLQKEGVIAAMAIGGTLDILSGKLQQVPAFMERLHLEWLFRLLQEPSRWRRQMALPFFALRVLAAKFFHQQSKQ